MRIAIFSGPIEYSICLANALSEYCEVDFFYSEKYAKERDSSILNILSQKVNKRPINQYRLRDPRNLYSFLKIAFALRHYNIVHMQSGILWLFMYRIIFKNIPIIATIHDPYQHLGVSFLNRAYQDAGQSLLTMLSSRVITHGEKLKNAVVARYHYQKDNVIVLPHGEFSFYKKMSNQNVNLYKKSGMYKRILFFGSVRKNKGLGTLISAESLLSKNYSNYKICIAGKFLGDREDYLKSINDRSRFEIYDNYVPNDQVANLFESSDIIVLPYVSASQSGVLALALSFGKPVIATNAGSISEVIKDGVSGVLIPPDDHIELAKQMLRLCTNSELCDVLSKNASVVADNLLSWQNIAQSTHLLYKRVIDEKR